MLAAVVSNMECPYGQVFSLSTNVSQQVLSAEFIRIAHFF